MMSDEEKRLREVLAYKVTPAPWTTSEPTVKGDAQVRAEESTIPTRCLVPYGILWKDDAALIAAARNAAPILLRELDRMRELEREVVRLLRWVVTPSSDDDAYASGESAREFLERYDAASKEVGT